MNATPYGQSFMAESLNLEPILFKLCHPTRGQGWEEERARRAAEAYRRWLWLHAAYPGENFSPSGAVDQVWHMHILDTRKYAEDCDAMFGRMLHHNPYAGMMDEAAEEQHQATFQKTRTLFAQHFGDEFAGEALCDSGYCDDTTAFWRPTLEDLPQAA